MYRWRIGIVDLDGMMGPSWSCSRGAAGGPVKTMHDAMPMEEKQVRSIAVKRIYAPR